MKPPAAAPGKVRIIGGKWRSRKLDVVEARDLRPTPDRVRETLFNWLQPWIDGASCLDLYAGTGSLGFEALSRGAAAVTMVDSNRTVTDALHRQALRLDAGGLRIVQEDAARFLASRPGSFDIVFLDPPFADQGLDQIIAALIDCGALHEGSLVYVESGGEVTPDGSHLRTVKSARAGKVRFRLLAYSQETE
jgi:16S rRNA (guanine(966)-N(2))-methyltransferase RsmD